MIENTIYYFEGRSSGYRTRCKMTLLRRRRLTLRGAKWILLTAWKKGRVGGRHKPDLVFIDYVDVPGKQRLFGDKT